MTKKKNLKKDHALEADDQLTQAHKKIAELEDQLLRCMADLQNVRKRAGMERIELLKNGGIQVIEKLLPTLLYFDQAVKNLPKELEKDNWAKGILAIEKMIFDNLKEDGLKEISQIDVTFDACLHEAVIVDENRPKNLVCEILEKGYMLNDKVLKVAKVKVGDKE